MTAGIFAGRGGHDGGGIDDLIDAMRDRDERFCRLLLCLTSPEVMTKGIDKKLRETGEDLVRQLAICLILTLLFASSSRAKEVDCLRQGSGVTCRIAGEGAP